MARVAGITLVAAFLVAACGGAAATPTIAPTPTATVAATPTASAVNVTLVSNALGSILVGPNGNTLYAFTPDQTAGKPTCYTDCAALWPPLTVSGDFTVGTGLDKSIFKLVARDDGSQQLALGQYPLYYYQPDTKPGDTLGQGLFDKWFVIAGDGSLIGQAGASGSPAGSPSGSPSAGTTVTVATNALGQILVGADGKTLYGFTPDEDAGKPTCNADCADAWPPLTVTGTDFSVGTGLDKSNFKLVARDDGTMQLQVGNYPLYYFASDAAAGNTTGQGKFDKWFVAGPDGELIGEPGG